MLDGIKKLLKGKELGDKYTDRKIKDMLVPAIRNLQDEDSPRVYDVSIAAFFDTGKDADWMELQFRRMNEKYKIAWSNAIYAMQYKTRYYLTKKRKDLLISNVFRDQQNNAIMAAYKLAKKFEDNIYRADNDQTCECKPFKIAIKEDLVTIFGLAIMIENFMLFNNLQFDIMQVGAGTSDPFGGDKALEALTTSVSIIDKGFSIPYGVEARHGAPFLATLAGTTVAEVGVQDSISGNLFSRSVFPASKRFDHVQNFDAYSILHITQLKAV